MSQREKLMFRILRVEPIPRDITPHELMTLIQYLGLSVREGSGSHVVIYGPLKDGYQLNLTVPVGGRKTILPPYIRQLRNALNDHGI